MSFRSQISALIAILMLVEVSSLHKLGDFYSWTNSRVFAYLVAVAFIALLLGSIVVLAHDLPQDVSRTIRRAMALLLYVQGTANVLVSFESARTLMPVDVVASFFNIPPDWALKVTASIQGLTLSLVSIAFWHTIGLLLHNRREEREARAAQLHQFESQEAA